MNGLNDVTTGDDVMYTVKAHGSGEDNELNKGP